jgi:hypothetical protein
MLSISSASYLPAFFIYIYRFTPRRQVIAAVPLNGRSPR